MAFLLRVPVLACLTLALWGAEPPAVAELQLADGAVLAAHWEQTPWAKVWADPACEALRAPCAAWLAALGRTLGAAPDAVLAASRSTRLTLRPGTAPGKPAYLLSADAGAYAARLCAAFASANPGGGGAVAADDEVLGGISRDGDRLTLARFANALVLAVNADAARPEPRRGPLGADMVVRADLPGLCALAAGAGADAQAMRDLVAQLVQGRSGEVRYSLDLTSEGVLERAQIDSRGITGLRAVDRSALARLPATTLMAMAVGCDGAAYWKAQRGMLLRSWAPLFGCDPARPEATEAVIDAAIARLGVAVRLADLVSGWVGTTLIAIGPGQPFPTLTVAVPRSVAMDKLITAMALGPTGGAMQLVPGASAPVAIPGLPVAVSVTCDRALWVISSDPAATAIWSSGKPNGWSDTVAARLALSKAPADAFLIAASDTPAVLALVASTIDMHLGAAAPAELKRAMLRACRVLAERAAPGYAVGGSRDGGQVIECRSITGVATAITLADIAARLSH